MDPPLIILIKNKHNDNSDKDFVNIKLRRDMTSEKLELYVFKMALFSNGNTEEFLFFVCNFNMTLEVSEMLKTTENMQYLCTIFCGEALHKFDTLSADIESISSLKLVVIILVLGMYFFLLM